MTSFGYRLNPFYLIKECSSCGALYTKDYCCSVGILRDKIICDLDKTPDLSQRSPQNYPKCGHPVNGHYCQGCALLRKKFKEDLFTSCVENKILQDSSEPSNDNTNILACYEDDDDDYAFAIIPNEPNNSLSMGDEHLDTIPSTILDEFIKSSVENRVLIPSEFEGENKCDVPACEAFTTFSNTLFDPDYDFYSSDDQSFSNEDFSKEIYSNPLFDEEIIPMKIDPHHFIVESDLIESMLNHDYSIISSSKIDSLFDEFTGELPLLKSVPPGIDETDCDPEEEIHFIKRLLNDNSSPRPPEEFVFENSDDDIESFYPSPIHDDDYDTERDILIFEDLLSNNSILLPENELFHFDIPSFSCPPAKPPDGNTGILNVKMMGSEQKVPMPRLMITLVPNQEKSPDLLSHQGLEAFQPFSECPMMIHGKNTPILDVPLFHFYPLINSSMGKLGQAQRPKTSASWEAPHAYP
nr:hypothetical protein [Tanacetum cinerariifolium]